MPIAIDGNNLLHSLPEGERTRSEVRRRVLEIVRNDSLQVILVFDGPPSSGMPETEHLGLLTVRYAGSVSADTVLLGLIPEGDRAAKWIVVSDDSELGARVRSRGGQVRSLGDWKRRQPAKPRRPTYEPKLSSHDVADWEAFFSDGREED
ncbi:MAG: NYN domain-containing protein [Thermoanaerobaculales bacterium]